MQWLTLKRLLRGERGMQKADLYGQIAAIHKAQAVIEFDLEGHVLMANQNFLDTMGYELDEVLGQHHRMFVVPEDRESAEYLAFWDKLGQGAHDAGRYRRIRRDGSDVWLQASTTRSSINTAVPSRWSSTPPTLPNSSSARRIPRGSSRPFPKCRPLSSSNWTAPSSAPTTCS
ncbi:PAS domain-containing protein [Achromobacter insuavis]|uniref:PAS domain-containing protein n=1 Tax=Achromobacter insuavis TaxID=1287735 RepID=UPI003D663478